MENLPNISHGRVISTSELYDNNPETAGRYSGLVSKEEIGEEVNEYDLLYLDTTSESMRKASSGEDGKKQACCMALRNGDSGAVIPVLWLGQVTNKAWSWSKKGVALYLGIEAGGLTENQIGQYIGFAVSSTKIHFMPQQGMLSTGGPVSAGLKVVTQAATDTLTAAECQGCVISNYGQAADNTQTLPAAAEGLHGLVVIGTAGAGAFHLKAGTGDKIYLDGKALDDGDKVSLATPAVGDNFTFFSFQTGASAYDWIVTSGSQGTLTDGGA